MNITDLKVALPLIASLGRTAMLHGKHGEGKSQVIRQIFEALDYKVADVRLGQMADAGDLIGLPKFEKDKQGNDYLQYVFPDFFPRQSKTVIFFDELNRAPKDILQGVFEMVLDYSLKGKKLPPDTVIIAAVNPATDDYAVLDFSDSAFQDRFVHLSFTPTPKEFFGYMKTKYANSAFLEFLQDRDNMLSDPKLGNVDLSFVKPSRRSWEVAMMWERLYDEGKMNKGIFQEVLQGIVGLEPALAAVNFKETNITSLKAAEMIEKFHDPAVKAKLEQAIKKKRTDMIGTMIDDMGKEFAARKGLTNQEGLNVIEIVKTLGTEQAFTLGKTIAANHTCCSNVEGMPGDADGQGLLGNDDLIAQFEKIKKARDKAEKELAKKADKKSGKKTEEL